MVITIVLSTDGKFDCKVLITNDDVNNIIVH